MSVNFIAGHSVPKSMTLEEIQEATSGDPELQAVIKAVEIGKWRRDSPYHKVRQELINTITTDGIRPTRAPDCNATGITCSYAHL